jgi:hypothetical protein
MLDEQLKGLQIDQSNIAKIIAFTTNKKEEDIQKDIHDRIALSPEAAKSYGPVTEIKNTLMPANAEFHSIGELINRPCNCRQSCPKSLDSHLIKR